MHGEEEDGVGGDDNSQIFRKFVQEHLKSFLKPIAEHVEELKYDLSDLRSQAKASSQSQAERASAHEARTGALTQRVQTLASDVEKEGADQKHEIAALGRRAGKLEAAMQDVVSSLQQLNVRLDNHDSAAEQMREALENSNSNMTRLQLKHWQTQGLAQKVETGLAELKDEHLALCERHTSIVRSLAQSQQGLDAQRLALGSLNAKLEASEKKLTEELESLGNKVALAERGMAKLKDVQLEQGKQVGPLVAEMGRISQTIAKLENEFEGAMQGEEDEFGGGGGGGGTRKKPAQSYGGSARSMAELDSVIQEVRQVAQNGGDKRLQEMVHACVNRVKKLSDEFAEAIPNLRTNTATLASQQNLLADIDLQMRDHDTRQTGLQDRISRVEGELSTLSSNFHDATVKAQNKAVEIEKLHSASDRTMKDIQELQGVVRQHGTELKSSEQTHLHLQSRVEVAYEYLHGLGKGLQDTHRSVLNGNEGLLGPRPTSASRNALPNLTLPTPRTGSSRFTDLNSRPTGSPVVTRQRSSALQ